MDLEWFERELDTPDLPHEYIYDNDDPYVPSCIGDRDTFDDPRAAAKSEVRSRQISRHIPPEPHSSFRRKDGTRIYKIANVPVTSKKAEIWKQAYNILDNKLKGSDVVAVKENVNTQIHPCLHRIQRSITPETDTKCPLCKKPIAATKVFQNVD